MPIPTTISDLTPVASTNSPQGTESVKGTIDDYLRAHASFIRQLSDQLLGPTVSLTSGAQVGIGFAGSINVAITGTATITSFDNAPEGTMRWATFNGALTLTHNANSLQLPGAANIQTAAGDVAVFKSLGGGNWKCMAYERVSGLGLVQASMTTSGFLSVGDWNSFNSRLTPAAAAAAYLALSGGGTVTGRLFLKAAAPGSVILDFKHSDDRVRAQVGFDANGTPYLNTYDASGGYTGGIAIQGGGFDASGTISAQSLTGKSDDRLKKTRRRRPADFLQRIAGLKKVGDFLWKKGGSAGIGGSAQELEAIWPEAVHTDEHGMKSINYGAAAFVIAVELARAFFAYVAKTEKRLAKLEGK